MDVYILDDQNRRIQLIDTFVSFIWAERFSTFGDFELHTLSTPENRALFKEGVRLSIPDSYRVMKIETIEDKDDEEGRSMLTVKGRSLESIFIDRIASTPEALAVNGSFVTEDTPQNLMLGMVNQICVVGLIDSLDIIPRFSVGSYLPAGNIPYPSDSIRIEVSPMTLYDYQKMIGDVYGIGFAIVKNVDTGELYFQTYSGFNRTSAQESLAMVAFSPNLDNLTNVSNFRSEQDHKNVALVTSKFGSVTVYAEDIGETTSGFDRKVLLVEVSDVDEDTPNILEVLRAKGKEALANHRKISVFDGEIPNYGYRYGVDYLLGDVVEMQDGDGEVQFMRVMEQIFVSDQQGDRTYPSLVKDLYIQPGTWDGWNVDQVWDDVPDELVWDDVKD